MDGVFRTTNALSEGIVIENGVQVGGELDIRLQEMRAHIDRPAHSQHGIFRIAGGEPAVCDQAILQHGSDDLSSIVALKYGCSNARFQSQARAFSAASTVCSINVLMVIGPTPPGTGVYAEARSATAASSISPTLSGW